MWEDPLQVIGWLSVLLMGLALLVTIIKTAAKVGQDSGAVKASVDANTSRIGELVGVFKEHRQEFKNFKREDKEVHNGLSNKIEKIEEKVDSLCG